MRRLVDRSARPRWGLVSGAAAVTALLCPLASSPALAQRPPSGHARSSVAASGSGSRERAASFAVRGAVSGDDIVREARRFIGVPYRMGGTTPAAFDCSGFVRRVFAEYGVELPRTAHEQAGVGRAPDEPGDLRPGDLLFFYGGRGAQHIAIYVGGDTIIHASSRGRRVQLDRLGGAGRRRTWFNERLIAVRRVAPVEGVFRLEGVSASAEPAPAAPPPSAAPSRGEQAHARGAAAAATTSVAAVLPKS